MSPLPDPIQDPRFAEILSDLRNQPIPEPSADFSSRVMRRLGQKTAPRKSGLAFGWRAAAAVAILLAVVGLWVIPSAPRIAQRPPTPVEILMAAQRSDGGWSADAQNPRSRYDIGVTALALLALIHADPAALEGPSAPTLRSGMAHLLRQQRADGRFGGDYPGAAFTDYLAGKALQAAARLSNADPAWAVAAGRAAPHSPSEIQMAKLNNSLAHPDAFPARWAEVGGIATQTAIRMLRP